MGSQEFPKRLPRIRHGEALDDDSENWPAEVSRSAHRAPRGDLSARARRYRGVLFRPRQYRVALSGGQSGRDAAVAADRRRAVPCAVVRLSGLARDFSRHVFGSRVFSLRHDDGVAAGSRVDRRRHSRGGGGGRLADQSLGVWPQSIRHADRHRQMHGDHCGGRDDQLRHRNGRHPPCHRRRQWSCACRSDRRLGRSVDHVVARGCGRHRDRHARDSAVGQYAAAPHVQDRHWGDEPP